MALGIMVGNRIDNGVAASAPAPSPSNLLLFPNNTHTGPSYTTLTDPYQQNFTFGGIFRRIWTARVTQEPAIPIMKACLSDPTQMEYTRLRLQFFTDANRTNPPAIALDYTPGSPGVRVGCGSPFVVPFSPPATSIPVGDYWVTVYFVGQKWNADPSSYPYTWTTTVTS